MILLGASLAAVSSTSEQTTAWQKKLGVSSLCRKRATVFLVDLLLFAGILRTDFFTSKTKGVTQEIRVLADMGKRIFEDRQTLP